MSEPTPEPAAYDDFGAPLYPHQLPAEPDAGDVEALADRMAHHDGYRVNEDGWTVCLCGHIAEGDDDDGSHARHVAAVLMPALAEVRRDTADTTLREFRRLAVRCYPKGMVPTSQVVADINERIERLAREEASRG